MMYGEASLAWQKAKRRLVVFALLVAMTCLSILPVWPLIGIHPTLFLIALYHWGLYRSDLLPVDQLVLLSLIQDGLYAYPLGFSALRILSAYALLMTQKRTLASQSFLGTWGGFCLFVIIDALIYMGLLSCVKHHWVGILPLVPGMMMTAALYPTAIWFLNRWIGKRLPA